MIRSAQQARLWPRYDINSITDDVKVVTSFNNILKRILRFLNGTEETFKKRDIKAKDCLENLTN
ncbi:hypothetical protein FF38_05075 [Lucilia cuprina]|uniref:Uncharacterized protein n=1 Tax=Lucilia cuprina TaxID=7375 RepID=A0A0L0CBS8_LUCCU|nr:hypothetical protein FF38_05075 [Lucilia cuprina]